MARLRHKLLWTGLLVVIAAIPLTVHADSVILFNTFGPGHTYDCCQDFSESGSNVGPYISAMAFTPNTTSPLFAIDLAIGSGQVNDQFTLALMSTNGGLPGSILESWSLTTTFHLALCNHCFETALSTLHPVLQGGTQYWLVVFPSSDMDGGWFASNDAQGTSAFSSDRGKTWTPHANSQMGAFDVRGISNTAVPEPSTIILLGSGLLGITAARRKTRRAPKFFGAE
ncbi:MAG: hypothetical protein DMG88_11615 [Acidobacteria bacterium]|nr:MAG: hypothetical protein DMG88_11615 [Acidobacteriota bacterium]